MSRFLNSPTLVEYRTSPRQKAKSRQAAYDKKYGSPKLELLRQKCRIRAKEARGDNYSSGRRLFNDKTYIEKIVLEELTELDLKLEDIILKEILDEANEWFAEALENEENYLISNDDTSLTVFCPICQRHSLEASSTETKIFKCKCGIRFNYSSSLNDFHKKTNQIVANHEAKCDATLGFFVEPNRQDYYELNAFCDACEFFQTIK